MGKENVEMDSKEYINHMTIRLVFIFLIFMTWLNCTLMSVSEINGLKNEKQDRVRIGVDLFETK